MAVNKSIGNEPIYQLKVTLKGSSPRIWRRIRVAGNISLDTLHLVLQAVMGWENDHLYRFHIGDVEYSEPDADGDLFFAPKLRNAQKFRLSKVVPAEKARFLYEYDFGDCWEHEILVEKIMAAEPGVRYPVCAAGERACPPEDCGGVWSYAKLLEIIGEPTHEEYEERMEWLGGHFDPEAFDLQRINEKLKRIR